MRKRKMDSPPLIALIKASEASGMPASMPSITACDVLQPDERNRGALKWRDYPGTSGTLSLGVSTAQAAPEVKGRYSIHGWHDDNRISKNYVAAYFPYHGRNWEDIGKFGTLAEAKQRAEEHHQQRPMRDQEVDTQRQRLLEEALAVVRAAGYRVSKPRTSKRRNPKDRVGPTFVAEFADGTVTRMSTFTSLKELDWSRGEYMARHAWASRRKAPPDWDSAKLAEAAPPIIACRFEQNGKVLAQRNGAGGASCP